MKHTCRDYQEEDIASILKEWEDKRSTLYVAATGLGKTKVMVEVVDRRTPKRAILLAHRSELIWQARDAFLRHGIEVEVEKGELAASTNLFSRSPVVLATVQTLNSGEPERKRMLRFNPMDFDTLLYDESHHSVSKGNKAIVDYFINGNPNLKVLGVTATPDRADEEALGQIFESVASERDILFGVDNGWLVEPEQLMVHIGSLDFSHMKTTAGDLNLGELSEAMESESVVQGVVQPTLEAMFRLQQNVLMTVPIEQWGAYLSEIGSPRRTIVFTVSVKQAEQLSDIFNRVIPGLSQWVCGKTADDARQEIFKDFDTGRCAVLVNCGVTTEGYDNPAVELIVVARPTKSRSIYAQMVGRSTRPLPGIVDLYPTKQERIAAISLSRKPKATVLDLVGNSGKHKLVCLADLLGGEVSDAAIQNASKKAKESKAPVNMRQLLAEEEEKLIEAARQFKLSEEARRAKMVAKVKYTSTKVNPFDAFDIHPARQRGWHQGKELSTKQKEMLMKQGIDPSSMTFAEGSQLIQTFFARWRAKLATLKQCAVLKKHGYNTKNMPMETASKLITALANNGWRRPDLDGIAEGMK